MTPEDVVRAQGKLVALFAAVLEGAGVKTVEEFGSLLGVYAVAVAEDQPVEGEILGYWAGAVRSLRGGGT